MNENVRLFISGLTCWELTSDWAEHRLMCTFTKKTYTAFWHTLYSLPTTVNQQHWPIGESALTRGSIRLLGNVVKEIHIHTSGDSRSQQVHCPGTVTLIAATRARCGWKVAESGRTNAGWPTGWSGPRRDCVHGSVSCREWILVSAKSRQERDRSGSSIFCRRDQRLDCQLLLLVRVRAVAEGN